MVVTRASKMRMDTRISCRHFLGTRTVGLTFALTLAADARPPSDKLPQ
jgi:hypothetical protein